MRIANLLDPQGGAGGAQEANLSLVGRVGDFSRGLLRSARFAGAAARLMLVDRGWFGCTPLERHVVICGFPRSGSTLLALMIRCCVAHACTYDREVPALRAARTAKRNHRFMVTKRPKDIFDVDAIRAYYRNKRAKPLFILTVRDPRSVLTSRHVNKNGYYVDISRWRSIWEQIRAIDPASDDVLVVRYEALVRRCSEVQAVVAHFAGWTCTHDFERFWSLVPSGFEAVALNGVRSLDESAIDKWREPRHVERIRSLLQSDFPDLCDHVVALGYEPDGSWAERYRER